MGKIRVSNQIGYLLIDKNFDSERPVKMKVFIFIPRLNSGGAEKAAICQANALSNSNYEVTLLVLDPSNPMTPINNSVKIKPLCKRMRYAIFALPRYISKEKPDVIISHLSVANFICYCNVNSNV